MSDKSCELSLIKARDFKILNFPCSGEKNFINANLILCINCSYARLRDKLKGKRGNNFENNFTIICAISKISKINTKAIRKNIKASLIYFEYYNKCNSIRYQKKNF